MFILLIAKKLTLIYQKLYPYPLSKQGYLLKYKTNQKDKPNL
ncbi:hypothetical protein BN855_1200 [Salmonella enterica subsp. enterica serovar Bovismorbificans str. 3114]|nr:hypothetical protein BN855_1200 [Salmonella enterica subsp. enterica serovar Bovismorbificans str. 3114]